MIFPSKIQNVRDSEDSAKYQILESEFITTCDYNKTML